MKNLTLGFLGMGNIGSGVARVLAQNAAVIAHRDEMTFTIKKALVRSLDKARNTPLGPEAFGPRRWWRTRKSRSWWSCWAACIPPGS